MVFVYKNNLNSHKRFDEKIKILVEWLAKFDFSTRQLMGLAMSVNSKGQGAFFKKMEEMNIIYKHTIAGTNKIIYSLSDIGNQLSSMYFPDVHIKEKRKKPSLVAISHSFNIQFILADYLHKHPNITYTSEKQLMNLNLQRRPDAIINMDGKKYAIEVEITKKSMQKIYYNYAGHLKNVRQGLYDRVIYIFNNKYTLEFYKRLNNESIWPVFDKSNTGGRLIQRKENGISKSFDSRLIKDMNIFDFQFNDMYIL